MFVLGRLIQYSIRATDIFLQDEMRMGMNHMGMGWKWRWEKIMVIGRDGGDFQYHVTL